MGKYSSFVIKIWTDEKQGVSRGQIQHVGSDELLRFVDMQKMIAFIDSHLDASEHPQSRRDVKGVRATSDE